MDIEGN
jgi:hypothetical protein